MNIYSTIRARGCEDGRGFLLTPDGCSVEVHIYCGIIIYAKSVRLSFDEMCDALGRAEAKELSIRQSEVDPGSAQAAVVLRTFPPVAASVLDKHRAAPSQPVRLVRILPGLVRGDKDHGVKAFDLLRRNISVIYPGFLPDVAAIKSRIDKLGEEFGIHLREHKPLPADILSVPQWIFSSFDFIEDGPLKDSVLYFVFFGDPFKKLLRVTVEKETSLGAKQGHAILSKAIYPELADSASADIFKGVGKLGTIKIDWHTGQKKTVAFTKADFDRLGLRSDDQITLILGDS